MSVSVCLCKTDVDDLVSWPFTKRVTVTLLDQRDEIADRRDVTQTIDPANENPAVARRPKTDRGPPFGIKNFIRLEQLNLANRYVYNDTVFFRIQIED